MSSVMIKPAPSSDSIYSPDDLALLDVKRIPRHIAIIMDGNRRWAKKNRLPQLAGHWQGAEQIIKIIKAATELGVKVLTLFSFSSENWTRSKEEIEVLMKIINTFLVREKNAMIEKGVRLDTIGDLSRIPPEVAETLEECKQATKDGTEIELVLALNYGGRDDIRRAAVAIANDCIEGKLSKENISEKTFASYLDTSKWQDPDLMIRTSGEKRLSNFLLWQLSYTEIYITDVFWPDFCERDFFHSILEFQARERRLGGP